jgi:hypothetical protein
MRAKEFINEDEPVRIKLGGSTDAAKTWIQKVYNLYPQTFQNNHVMPLGGDGEDQQFAMFELTPSFSKRGAVEVKWIQAYPLRQGVGSKAMAELQRLAKEDGISLTLFPWDKGQVSQSKLTKFYKGQGFKPTVKGSKNMFWDPTNEMVTELFSPKGGLPIEWKSNMGAVYATAIDHNTGKQIEIHFWQLPKDAVEIDFMVDESYQMTNKGDQFIVFATVVNAIKEYDERYAPKYLIFSAKEASRKSLYTQMVKRLAPTVGYSIGTIKDLPQEVHDNISLNIGDFVLIHNGGVAETKHMMREGAGSTTLAQLYNGNYPDRDETFWDYVSSSEFDTPLEIQTLPKHKVMFMLLGQYRAEHIDDVTDMLDDDRMELVQSYMNDPTLSSKVIVLSGDRIIDGNHRALAAALKGVPINYVDLTDLEEQDIEEVATGGAAGVASKWTGNELYRKLV